MAVRIFCDVGRTQEEEEEEELAILGVRYCDKKELCVKVLPKYYLSDAAGSRNMESGDNNSA